MRQWIASTAVVCALALPAGVAAQSTLVGSVTNVWADPVDGSRPILQHRLTESDGTQWILDFDGTGGELVGASSGEQWRVHGAPSTSLPALLAGGALRRFRVGHADRAGPALRAAPPTTLRYQILWCEASDGAQNGFPPAFLATSYGNTPPNVGDFFRDVSEGQMTFEVAGIQQVMLPSLRAVYGGNPVPGGGLSYFTPALARDCTNGATGVNWGAIDGVALHVNWSNNAAFGGSDAVTIGGQVRQLRVTWIPTNSSSVRTLIHEVGHSIGWSHSGSDYGSVTERQYDNGWDVMGISGLLPPTAVQTVAVNRAASGWISTDRWSVIQPGEERELTVEIVGTGRAGGRASGAVDLIELLSPNGGRRVSAEARLQAGPYDRWIPFPGIVLHRLTRPIALNLACCLAKLIDPDGNGLPWDEGPALAPGERYEHPDGLGIEVLDSTANGYRVRVWSGWPFALTVKGPGTVGGVPGRPACSGSCRTVHASIGLLASLVPAPEPPAAFRGWTGDCTGSGTCTVPLDRPAAVTAWFGSAPFLRGHRFRPYAVVGRPYDDTLQVDTEGGGTFSVTAAGLPPGLALSPSSGRVTGTPTSAGATAPILTMTAAGGTTTDTVTLRVLAAATTIADSVFLLRYREVWLPVPVGGGGPLGRGARVVTGVLHDGLQIGGDGALGGTPHSGGVRTVTVAFDLPSGTAQATYHLVVVDRAPHIVTTSIPGSQWVGGGINYRLQLEQDDPATWSVVSGTLPAGIALLPQGTLLGQYTAPGVFPFGVEARRGTLADTVALTLVVDAPNVRESDIVMSLLRRVPVTAPEQQYMDFLGNRNGMLDVGDLRAFLRLRGQISGGGTP